MSNVHLTGKHLIAGTWLAGTSRFQSSPFSGGGREFSEGTADLIAQAASKAEEAFESYGWSSRKERAVFLRAIAEEIEAIGAMVTEVGCQETGLPKARLDGERGRTTGQLRLFADHIEKGDYLDKRHDAALPERAPLPRPDLKMIQRPIGPVAVFGASNFPLAFSTAGGDTAAALAAGCPVIVKGHPAHPGTGELIAQAIARAMNSTQQHPGVFSFIQGHSHTVGTDLVQHPLIRAVGFTGSLAAGRALFDLCMQRPEPIPFFGELGSINPMFCLPHAMRSRAGDIGAGWAASLTMGAGQFCTNPGIAVMLRGDSAADFTKSAVAALQDVAKQGMLTTGIAQAYRDGIDYIAASSGVEHIFASNSQGRSGAPNLFKVSQSNWLANSALQTEVFGPSGIIVEADDMGQVMEIARALEGQLTCTLHMDKDDHDASRNLLPILERKAGRLLVNGFPTGVEVADTMVHGGPYPASTNFGATSVGTLAIRRFLRPVCYQNIPLDLLPEMA